MARKLGFATFTPLGYRRMRRVDYGPDDVARYREQVARACGAAGRAAAGGAAGRKMAGIRLRFWDEALIDPGRQPEARSAITTCWLRGRRTCSTGMDPRLGRVLPA